MPISINNLTKNNFSTFSPKDANTSIYHINDFGKSDEQNFSTVNYNNSNYGIISKQSHDDYFYSIQVLINSLVKISDHFSLDMKANKKFYYTKLINFFTNIKLKNQKTRSGTFSDKSSKYAKLIVSDRYQIQQESNEFDTFINNNKNYDNIFNNKNSLKNNPIKNNNYNSENINELNYNGNFPQNVDNSVINSNKNSRNTNILNLNNYYNTQSISKKSFLKYPTNLISENSSYEEDEEYNTNEKIKSLKKKKSVFVLSNEILYFAKILVKISCSHYKRSKNVFLVDFLNRLKQRNKWNKILYVLHKNINTKQLLTLDIYFNKLRKINRYYNGIKNISKIIYKYMRFLFEVFGHQTRVVHIIKKNLIIIIRILKEFHLRKKKFFLISRLYEIANFKDKLPCYQKFISSFCKAFKRSTRKKTIIMLKKYYLSLKIFSRNLNYLISIIENLIIEIKKQFMIKLISINKIRNKLRSLVTKKHIKRLILLKKWFHLLIENSLTSNAGLNERIKLKKVFKIYSYKLKFQTVKVFFIILLFF